MAKDKLIAYDLGTGGIKASLFCSDGTSLAEVFEQYETFFPHDLRVEQRPEDWWQGVCHATKKLLLESGADPSELACAALSGHSLVAVPLDRQRRLLQDQVPIWCDMRAEDQLSSFFKDLDYTDWYTTTGNGDPAQTYTILKLMWMKEHERELYDQTDVILGSKDYINFRLTGSVCTDPSYASGFGVFNLKAWDYEDRFFEASGIPRSIFPSIAASDSIIGYVTAQASEQTGLPAGLPVACGAVDNTCMSIGARGLEEGSVYASLGSSSWIAVTSREPIVDPVTRPFVFAHAKPGYYTSAVSIFSAGNSFRWIRDRIMADHVADTSVYDVMNQMAQSVPPGSRGVLFNPSLAGGSAQEPSANLYGAFMGLRLGTTREDLVRASMEGVAMALRMTLDILKKQTALSGDMLLTGGCSKSAVWRRIFCDVFNMPVLKTNVDQDAASLGAAALAANATGLWNSYDRIGQIHREESRLVPDPANNAVYEALLPIYAEWTRTLSRLGDELQALKVR